MSTRKKVVVAASAEEATKLLTAYADSVAIDFDSIDSKTKTTTIGIAMNTEFGMEEAEKSIDLIRLTATAASGKKARETYIAGDYHKVIPSGDDLVNGMIDQAYESYVNGGEPNLTMGGGIHTEEEIEEAYEVWIELGNQATGQTIRNFHAYKRQDKAAAGKASVGATLDTRKVQANFIATWGSRKINVHVDRE